MEADHVFALNYCNKIKCSQMYSSCKDSLYRATSKGFETVY